MPRNNKSAKNHPPWAEDVEQHARTLSIHAAVADVIAKDAAPKLRAVFNSEERFQIVREYNASMLSMADFIEQRNTSASNSMKRVVYSTLKKWSAHVSRTWGFSAAPQAPENSSSFAFFFLFFSFVYNFLACSGKVE